MAEDKRPQRDETLALIQFLDELAEVLPVIGGARTRSDAITAMVADRGVSRTAAELILDARIGEVVASRRADVRDSLEQRDFLI